MPIVVTCPGCGNELRFTDASAGKRGRCPNCQTQVVVPSAEPPVVEAEVVEGAYQYEVTPPPPPPVNPTDDRRPCPACGELIHKSAIKCRFCNEIFDPALKRQEQAKKRSFSGGEGDDLSVGEWLVAILCSGIGCIVGIIWMIQGKPKGKKMFLVSLCVNIVVGVIRAAIESGMKR